MSQEISNTTQFTYRKNGVTVTRNISTVQDAAGNGQIQNVQSVGTTDETLDKGDIGTIGFLYAKNLDGTNYVDLGPDGTLYPVRLKAGCDCRMPWNTTAVHVKANTAACLVDYVLAEV